MKITEILWKRIRNTAPRFFRSLEYTGEKLVITDCKEREVDTAGAL